MHCGTPGTIAGCLHADIDFTMLMFYFLRLWMKPGQVSTEIRATRITGI
ncbi:MAG: hypothetical protein [Olavius algarvensis Delta 4 endosymbiont]|nr:MAG: hypothetical protein [Olavius algarvensis Delta 4 endosymbiont]